MTVIDVWSRERNTWKLVFSTGADVSPPRFSEIGGSRVYDVSLCTA